MISLDRQARGRSDAAVVGQQGGAADVAGRPYGVAIAHHAFIVFVVYGPNRDIQALAVLVIVDSNVVTSSVLQPKIEMGGNDPSQLAQLQTEMSRLQVAENALWCTSHTSPCT